MFTASTHDHILFFTDAGRVYRKKGYLIPEAGRAAKGTNIVNIIQVEPGEKVTTMMHIREFDENVYLVMGTRLGTIKRMSMSALRNIRSAGIRALRLDEGDELIDVRITDGSQNILMATRDGSSICFSENDVRPMGRDASGVRGIKLREGDWCVAMARMRPGATVLSVTENGYGKRTSVDEYMRGGEVQRRGGMGIKNYQVTEKTGPVCAVKVVNEDEDLLVISDDGTIIRMPVADVSVYGRQTQGVRLMKVSDGSRVISIARAEHEEEEEQPQG